MYFFVKVQNTQIFTIKALCRYICINNVKHSISKQGHFINKLINRQQSKSDPIEFMLNNSSDKRSGKSLSVYTIRRMNVLNKIFMEYITSMMSTGEIEPKILSRNIEISHVRITPDFKFLNIYWIQNSTDESDTEMLLQECAYKLRHELSQLRIMGNVPPIQFVKERNYQKLKYVEEKLSTLKFEEDFVPNIYPDAMYYTVTANTVSENHKEAKDAQMENISQNDFSVSIPVMKNDIFGLNHYNIMSKIKASLHKMQKSHKISDTNLYVDSNSTPKLEIKNVPTFITNEEQQKQFSKFLDQRRVQLKKKKRETSSKADNLMCDFKEQSYEIDDYENEDFFMDEDNEDNEEFYESVDDEFKKAD